MKNILSETLTSVVTQLQRRPSAFLSRGLSPVLCVTNKTMCISTGSPCHPNASDCRPSSERGHLMGARVTDYDFDKQGDQSS